MGEEARHRAPAHTFGILFRNFQFHDCVADVGHADLQPLMNWTAMRRRIVEPARDYIIGILEAPARHAEPFRAVTSHRHWFEVSHQQILNQDFEVVHRALFMRNKRKWIK